jgi:hypothetical protein
MQVVLVGIVGKFKTDLPVMTNATFLVISFLEYKKRLFWTFRKPIT